MNARPCRAVVCPQPAASQLSSRPLPVGAVRLGAGFWQDRQSLNRNTSIAAAVGHLRRAGNLQNFENLLSDSGEHGHLVASDADVKNFVDSDVYKWLEAVGWESVRGPLSPDVEAAAAEAIELILQAQDVDGYVNTWYQTQDPATRFSNLGFGHEMYCLGHLVQAGIAWSRARGDQRLLEAGRRFADLVLAEFGPGGREAVCGHPEIEMALVELSRETGDPRYSSLARAFVDRRGRGLLGHGRFGAAYYQDRVPFRDMHTVEGHAVRALYLACGAVDAAVETDDRGLLAAARQQWTGMVAARTYITGGVGSRHHGESFGEDFELPPERAYCETCAAIGVVMWSWRLLLTETDGRFADLIERELYNGLLAGVSLDGGSYHYVNPLRVAHEHPRETWFEIACCPPNLMRTLATVEQYVATETDEAVILHQYMTADVDAGRGRRLRIRTTYPQDGVIGIDVEAAGTEAWDLVLRVPGWVQEAPIVLVNGGAVAGTPEEGYLRLRRAWTAGDTVVLSLALPPRIASARPEVESVRGQAALERGPLVYCIEQVDMPPGVRPDDVVLVAEADPKETEAAVAGLPTITFRACTRTPSPTAWPYRTAPALMPPGDQVELQAVPYFAWGNRGSGPMRVWLPTS